MVDNPDQGDRPRTQSSGVPLGMRVCDLDKNSRISRFCTLSRSCRWCFGDSSCGFIARFGAFRFLFRCWLSTPAIVQQSVTMIGHVLGYIHLLPTVSFWAANALTVVAVKDRVKCKRETMSSLNDI